jgi:hypothetical protein
MWRNESIFEENFQCPNNIAHVIHELSTKIDRCERTHLNRWTHQNDIIFVGWKPRERWFKLNCDALYTEM